jgi:hypothetical protein
MKRFISINFLEQPARILSGTPLVAQISTDDFVGGPL